MKDDLTERAREHAIAFLRVWPMTSPWRPEAGRWRCSWRWAGSYN